MNLPNKLTVLRVILIPIFMIVIVFPILPGIWWRIVAAALFLFTALTDFLDGMIARRFNLITDFGKLMDPLADKLMVFGAMLCLLVRLRDDVVFCSIFVFAIFIVLLRELAVTSLRMLVSNKDGIVIAANWAGKVKTVSQIVFIMTVLLEPVAVPASWPIPPYLFTYITLAFMLFMTVFSGLNYFKAYLPHISKEM